MTTVRLRAKNQITLPKLIIQQLGIRQDDLLEIACVNGLITLAPRARALVKDDLMDYAGIAAASYGRTAKEIDDAIDKLRVEWTR